MAEHADTTKDAEYERRAPGWVVRCTRCGFTEPWGKYAIRLGAASIGKYTVRRCRGCGRIRFHAVEKHKDR